MSVPDTSPSASRFILSGHVQGVGLRPAVARLATELSLAGYVCNSADGVVLHVEGTQELIREFHKRLWSVLPHPAQQSMSVAEFVVSPEHCRGFRIVDSATDGPLKTRVPLDVATCEACLQDTGYDSIIRSDSPAADVAPFGCRHGYAFTSCAHCGPRYSIIEAMPFDRTRTSMRHFPMCESCAAEYSDPHDRRFHAQTSACPKCGPRLSVPESGVVSGDLVGRAVRAVLAGQVLAVKGLGGYQLVVDATNDEAVMRLRQRKNRPSKPLAVMVASVADAEPLADLNDLERLLIADFARPIVAVPARDVAADTSPSAAGRSAVLKPGLNDIGIFLPATPLHHLLVQQAGRPLVVTSGNVDGDPLAYDVGAAERDLADIADIWLHHDRDIVRPVDDSVVRVIGDRAVTIRCARGFAPFPLPAIEDFVRRHAAAGRELPAVLAAGGQQKNAIALFNGHQAVLGPHIGDLESLASRQRFIEHVEALTALYRCRPQVIAHDMHPDYYTTRWATNLQRLIEWSDGVHNIAVQHHHAHVVSAMMETTGLNCEVLGVAFDGTGAGPDGTAWGGEFLKSTASGFQRVAHLHSFRLPGGEAAIREPWRVAVSLLLEAGEDDVARRLAEQHGRAGGEVLKLASSKLSPVTTSAGRLFDGVAALILGVHASDYEGHPAMLLEAAADRHRAPLPSGSSLCHIQIPKPGQLHPIEIDWRPMIRGLLADKERQVPGTMLAAQFHRDLATATADVCRRFALPVVLTGGVFQNRLLTELLLDELSGSGLEVGRHSMIPPNDGGLAAGQLAIALAQIVSGETAEETVGR